MPEKGFRDDFYHMTRSSDEFTIKNTCFDFIRILYLFKLLFIIFITYRMFYFGYYKNFFILITGLAFINITFNYIVYNRLVPRKFKNQ